MSRGGRRFTAEALFVLFLIALVPGFLVGGAMTILLNSWALGAIFGCWIFLFGLNTLLDCGK